MPSTSITRRYHFEAAHWLPFVADDHKCHRIHGHNYLVDITVSGELNALTGFLIDFWDLDKVVQPLIDRIDHRCLNDIPGLTNPTAELIGAWFFEEVNDALAIQVRSQAWSEPLPYRVSCVRVFETRDCWADVKSSSGDADDPKLWPTAFFPIKSEEMK